MTDADLAQPRPVERRVNLTRYGVLLRRQPPVRVVYCAPYSVRLDACCDCDGQVRGVCSTCRLPYCARHLLTHRRRVSVPPDVWKVVGSAMRVRVLKAAGLPPKAKLRLATAQPMAVLEVNGKRISNHPPVRIAYCRVPHTGNVDAACAHRAQTCTTGSTECPDCRFTYCDHHGPRHIAHTALPQGMWQAFLDSLERELDACVEKPGRRLRVKTPSAPKVREAA